MERVSKASVRGQMVEDMRGLLGCEDATTERGSVFSGYASMSAIDWACNYQDPVSLWTCGASKGEPCTMISKEGKRYTLKWFHDCRQTDALAMETGASEISKAAFDEAAERLI